MSSLCPCDTGLAYSICCGVYHADSGQPAPSALALMRSRYSAFVLTLDDYLLQTWHASTRPARLSVFESDMQWLGLRIRGHEVIDAQHARVEFVARSKRHGKATRLHETSRFVLEEDRWFYIDGDLH